MELAWTNTPPNKEDDHKIYLRCQTPYGVYDVCRIYSDHKRPHAQGRAFVYDLNEADNVFWLGPIEPPYDEVVPARQFGLYKVKS